MKKILAIILTIILICSVTTLTSCDEASNVNHNINQSANNFEVLRKITVYNARTDLIILQIEGYMSLSNNTASELVITCKTGEQEYKKNYVYLNEYVLYAVEDISGTITDPFHYEMHFYTALPDININK